MAAIWPAGEGFPKEWGRTDWIDNVGEPPPEAEKRFGDVRFASPVPERKGLAAVKPADVVVQMAEFQDLSEAKSIDVGVRPADLQELPLGEPK